MRRPTHVPIGQGQIDFKAIAPKLLALPNVEWLVYQIFASVRIRLTTSTRV